MAESVGQVALDIVMGKNTVTSTIKGAMDDCQKVISDGSSGISQKVSAVGDTVSNAGKAFLPLSVAVGAAGVAMGKTAMDYQDGMANINTLLDDDSHLQMYNDTIKRVSNDTGKSLDDMQSGMYQAISSLGDNGQDTALIFETMARSAKAGGADTQDSVALISAAMKGYGDVNDESAKKISDLAFTTAKLGVTTFPELARSMQPLFPLASSMNLSYEDLFGTMATLTGVTGNTAEVTTQMKGVLSNCMKPTQDMSNLMEKYGYSSAQACIEQEGFAGFLKIVKDEANGDAGTMGKLFSSVEAVTAATALCGSQYDTFNEKLGAMQDSAGATDTAYNKLETQGDSLQKSMNRVKNAGETLGESLLSVLAPVIEQVSTGVSKFADWFNKLPQPAQDAAAGVMVFVAVLGPALIGIGKVISAVGSIMNVGGILVTFISGSVVPALSGLFAFILANPIVLIIAAVIAAVALLILNWDKVKEVAGVVWGFVKETVGNAVEGIKGFFGGLKEKAEGLWDGIKEKASTAWEGAKGVVSNALDATKENVSTKLSNIKQAYDEHGGGIVGAANAAMEGFKEYITFGLDEANALTGGKLDGLCEAVHGGMDNASQLVSDAIDNIVQFFQNLWDNVQTTVGNMVEGVKTKAGDLKQGIEDTINSAIEFIKELPQKALEWGKDMISGFIDGIKGKIQDVKDAASSVAEGISSFLHFSKPDQGPLANYETWMPDFINGLSAGITSNSEVMNTAITAMISKVVVTIQNTMQQVKQFLSTELTAIQTTLTTTLTQADMSIKNIFTGVKTFIQQTITQVKAVFSEALTTIQTTTTTVFTGIQTFLTTNLTTVKTFISTTINTVKTTTMQVLNTIKSFIQTTLQQAQATTMQILNTVKSFISTTFNNIKSTITTLSNAARAEAVNAFTMMHSGVSGLIERIRGSIVDGFERAVNYITSLSGQAFGWGRDMIQGIIDGINSMLGSVRSAVSSVASTISGYLHFSTPDEGPLANYETWMPDFMNGMAEGITRNADVVRNAVQGLSADMMVNPSMQLTAPALRGVGSENAGTSTADNMAELIDLMRRFFTAKDSDQNEAITVPVYIGNDLIDEYVLNKKNRRTIRSGGRA